MLQRQSKNKMRVTEHAQFNILKNTDNLNSNKLITVIVPIYHAHVL